jgi:hypothetical protein
LFARFCCTHAAASVELAERNWIFVPAHGPLHVSTPMHCWLSTSQVPSLQLLLGQHARPVVPQSKRHVGPSPE